MLAHECQRPGLGWVFCDDFESDRLAAYFEYDAADGRFVRAPGVGTESSSGMRAAYATTPQTSSGSLKLAFGHTPQAYFRPADAGTATYRELYWRIYVRYPADWQVAAATSFPGRPASSRPTTGRRR